MLDPERLAQIERDLEEVRAYANTIHACKDCGLPVQLVNVTFYLWEADRSWTIPVPVCPQCDQALGGLPLPPLRPC